MHAASRRGEIFGLVMDRRGRYTMSQRRWFVVTVGSEFGIGNYEREDDSRWKSHQRMSNGVG